MLLAGAVPGILDENFGKYQYMRACSLMSLSVTGGG